MKKIFCLITCLFAGAANAALIDLAPQSTSVNGGSITYTNLITPTDTFSDALFSLSIAGDFDNNNSSESVFVSMEGFSLGRIFDNDTSNDLFNFANDDYLGSHNNMITMTGEAIIPQANWASIIADGFINITFDLSSGVNCCTNPHAFTSGNIQFDNIAAVPEPASLALLVLGLAGLGFSRKRKIS